MQTSKDESKTNERQVQRTEDEGETSAILSFMNPEPPTVLLRKEHVNSRSSLARMTLCYVF